MDEIYVIVDLHYDYIVDIEAYKNIQDALDVEYNHSLKNIENLEATKERKEEWLKNLNKAYENKDINYFGIKKVKLK